MTLIRFPMFRSPFKSGSALASRLCKAAMLHRFRLVAKETQRQDLLAASSYREAKVVETEAFSSNWHYFLHQCRTSRVLLSDYVHINVPTRTLAVSLCC